MGPFSILRFLRLTMSVLSEHKQEHNMTTTKDTHDTQMRYLNTFTISTHLSPQKLHELVHRVVRIALFQSQVFVKFQQKSISTQPTCVRQQTSC